MIRKPVGRALNVVLLVVLLASLLAVGYLAVNPPQTTDPYTELYLLGTEGNASDFPNRLEPGESGGVIVGVTNHEREATDYSFRVVDQNTTGNDVFTMQSRTVASGETWETNVTVSFDNPGRHRVQFQLYKGTVSGDPYRTVWLWINVTAAEPTSGPNPVIASSDDGFEVLD